MKTIKYLVLFVVLGLPICIFLFLKIFGQNRFQEIPVFYQDNKNDFPSECESLELPHQIPAFSMVDQDSSLLTDDYLRGSYTIVSFYWLSGPKMDHISNQLVRIGNMFDSEKRVKILLFTVDPDRDTIGRISAYVKGSGLSSDKWRFLWGNETDLKQLAQCGFLIEISKYQMAPSDYIPKFILVDSDKRIRGYYQTLDREEIDRLIVETKILIHESDL